MYVYLMACAPHLSFLVVVFSVVILWVAHPSMGCEGRCGFCTIFVGVYYASWRLLWGVGGGGVGNSI